MKVVPLSRVASAITDALASLSDASAAPPTDGGSAPVATRLSGASFAEQEPDLAKEAGLTGRAMSGWAMAGSSLPE